MHANIPLSQLVCARNNPRRVKPQRDAHRRLVASIRAHGLIEPLVIRRLDKSEEFLVIAGGRRLAALREVHRGKDPKIACQVRSDGDAEALSLAENFVREPMHPLDEAEAFARLIREDDKDVAAVATDFGVTPAYVRQRMKLATLSDAVKGAYRQNSIDTGTAEAFAAVPEDKQLEVWHETESSPRNADHVRNIIANAWIDAKNALFDITLLPPEKISRDLFGDRVLVERQAFLAAQTDAMIAQQKSLQEAGWSEVILAPQGDIQDRLWRMGDAPVVYDDAIAKKLIKIDEKREVLESKLEEIDEDDDTALDAHQKKIDALDLQQEELTKDAPVQYSEPVKAVGTAFLILDPDGRARVEYRVPRAQPASRVSNGRAEVGKPPAPPTPDDLSDKQRAPLFTIQALAVRQALLDSPLSRKRVLVLILHPKVRGESLAIHHDSNETNVYAANTDGFTCPALDALRTKRAEIDPFSGDNSISDCEAYSRLLVLSEAQLDSLIHLLTVESLTAHLMHPTELVRSLATELAIDLRKHWRPDAAWLGNYQKLQLSNLICNLQGPTGGLDEKKKTELVEHASKLFADATEGRITDDRIRRSVNDWLPAGFVCPATDAGATAPKPAPRATATHRNGQRSNGKKAWSKPHRRELAAAAG
jgi:ParB family transcriptional regulator, chromosome partitioning protein